MDVFLITSELICGEKPVRVASNTMADAVAFTKKSSVPQDLGTVLHGFQVLSITKYLPQYQDTVKIKQCTYSVKCFIIIILLFYLKRRFPGKPGLAGSQ